MPGTVDLFRKYLNPVFIESGSLLGGGIEQALEAGYLTVFSMERDNKFFIHCKERFQDDVRVNVIEGDSRYILRFVLDIVKERATFWLDGHDDDDYPIMEELEAISKHHIKNHTIIIDDLRMLSMSKYGFDLETIKEKISSINDYTYELVEGWVENDILVAYVKDA